MATMTTAQTTSTPAQFPRDDVPRLENGDRLTQAEFLRRYDAMPDLKKAELIEGIVYMSSPVRHDPHGQSHADLMTWLGTYRALTQGVASSDNATIILDPDNVPQPDCLLFIKSKNGGRIQIDKGCIVGSPELVAEVAASSVSIDLYDKLKVYRRNGVREYLVWRVEDRQIDWFALRDGTYVPLPPGEDGIIRSEVFPGLWLDAAALLRGDLATVLKVLDRGIQSPPHAEFTAQMK